MRRWGEQPYVGEAAVTEELLGASQAPLLSAMLWATAAAAAGAFIRLVPVRLLAAAGCAVLAHSSCATLLRCRSRGCNCCLQMLYDRQQGTLQNHGCCYICSHYCDCGKLRLSQQRPTVTRAQTVAACTRGMRCSVLSWTSCFVK